MEQNRRARQRLIQLWPFGFDKGVENVHWRKDSLFNNGAGKSGYPSVEDRK
jgi:hypothetical protein